MKSKEEYDLEKLCPDCGGLVSLFTNTKLIQKLVSELMAGKILSTAQLKLLSGQQTFKICECHIPMSGVLNWPKLPQLKAILIPD
jgi:transcription initiation factor IIE alpha subunit